jgi:hypothetical protein
MGINQNQLGKEKKKMEQRRKRKIKYKNSHNNLSHLYLQRMQEGMLRKDKRNKEFLKNNLSQY